MEASMLLHEARTLLGVDPAISPRELRSRYRTLVKQLHPDGGGGDGGRLSEVLEAYRIVQRQLDRETIRTRSDAVTTTPSRSANLRTRRPQKRGGRAEPQPERARVATIKEDPRLLFTYGRWATRSDDPAVRRLAVQRIAESGLTAAQVFLKQALFDADRDVAIEAAIGLTRIRGSRTDRTIIALFDQLTIEQRRAIIEATAIDPHRWFRLLAYAEADHYAEVRERAAEIARTMGGR